MALVPAFAQDFIDSDIGLVIATAFHTLGAIGFLGGLVGYVAWHRHLRVGHNHARLLGASAAMTYLSILVNLVGGFMRTWGEGHPPIQDFASSPWVRAISLKHVFLFAGMGAAVYLFEVVARRHLAAFRAGTLDKASTTGHGIGVFLVALGILMAGVLGAASRVTPFGTTEEPPMEEEVEDHDLNETAEIMTVYENASGQLTSTAVDPNVQTGSFEVPSGAVSVQATLVWSPTQFDLGLGLQDPGGAGTVVTGTGGSLERELDDPAAGTWGFSVSSEFAVNVEWDVSIRVSYAASNETLMANSVVIAPGQFYEINTQMPLNGTLHWDWSAGAVIHFDVHSHFNNEVQYVVEMEADADTGSYTNEQAGGYSFLWENTGNLPVTLDYRVWGDFELDSIFPA